MQRLKLRRRSLLLRLRVGLRVCKELHLRPWCFPLALEQQNKPPFHRSLPRQSHDPFLAGARPQSQSSKEILTQLPLARSCSSSIKVVEELDSTASKRRSHMVSRTFPLRPSSRLPRPCTRGTTTPKTSWQWVGGSAGDVRLSVSTRVHLLELLLWFGAPRKCTLQRSVPVAWLAPSVGCG